MLSSSLTTIGLLKRRTVVGLVRIQIERIIRGMIIGSSLVNLR